MGFIPNYLISFVALIGFLLMDWGVALIVKMIKEHRRAKKSHVESEKKEILLESAPEYPISTESVQSSSLAGFHRGSSNLNLNKSDVSAMSPTPK